MGLQCLHMSFCLKFWCTKFEDIYHTEQELSEDLTIGPLQLYQRRNT